MKFTLGLVLGAVTTAVIVYYLNTDEGKALIDRLKKDAGEVGDNVAAASRNLARKGRSMVGVEPGLSYDNVN